MAQTEAQRRAPQTERRIADGQEKFFGVPFRDQSAASQDAWIQWARSHDWGDGSHNGGTAAFIDVAGRMAGLACFSVPASGEGPELEQPTFETGQELRAWAGY